MRIAMVQKQQAKTRKKMRANKIIPCLVAILLSTTAMAADDLIYIDQVGSSTDVTITQTGVGNTVGGTSGAAANNNRASITGTDQTLTITQTGDTNVLKLKMQDVTTTTGSTTYTAVGDNNTSIIDTVSTGAGNTIGQTIYGDTNTTNLNIRGNSGANTVSTTVGTNSVDSNSNTVNQTIYGTLNTQTLSITGGNSNTVTVMQGKGVSLTNDVTVPTTSGTLLGLDSATFGAGSMSDKATATVNIVGGSNNVRIGQVSGDATGNSTTLSITGSSNGVSVAQTGLGHSDNTLSLTGSSNVMNLQQNSTAGNHNTANIGVTGSNNLYNVIQTR